jgi:hypothetical protein
MAELQEAIEGAVASFHHLSPAVKLGRSHKVENLLVSRWVGGQDSVIGMNFRIPPGIEMSGFISL